MASLILVPCKSLSSGKSRLGGVMNPALRHALCRGFLLDTLELGAKVVGRSNIRIVSPDTEVTAIAAELGIGCLVDRGSGLNAAIDGAFSTLGIDETSPAPRDILIMPIDLVRADPRSIAQVLESSSDMVLVPDRHGRGTNLLRLPGAIGSRFRFHFGEDSYVLHREEARRLNLRVHVIQDSALAFDVDTPEDYAAWVETSDARIASVEQES